MSEDRKQRVVRVYGKDESGDGGPNNSDRWVDLAVLDGVSYLAPTPRREPGPKGEAKYREQQQHFVSTDIHYLDRDGTEAPDRYATHDVKVILDKDDDTQYVTVAMNEQITVNSGKGYDYVRIDKIYHSELEEDTTRKTTVVKVVQNEIDESFLTGGDQPQPPHDPDDYLDAVSSTNSRGEENFVNVEMIDEFQIHTGAGDQYQKVKFELAWKDDKLLSLDNVLQRSETDGEGMNPARLDPLQNIINYDVGGLAVEFGDKAGDPPAKKKK